MKQLYQSSKAISLGEDSRLLEIVVGSFEIYGHEFKESQLVLLFYIETVQIGAVYTDGWVKLI